MGARAVRGKYGWSDGGSATWDIEIPAFDKASLYQTMVTSVPAFFPPKQRCVQLKRNRHGRGKRLTHSREPVVSTKRRLMFLENRSLQVI
jgi:hypothetical protein